MSEEKLMDAQSFEALLDSSDLNPREGFLTKATVIAVEKDYVKADVGLKTEATISIREFGADEVKVGDIVDVYVERYEGPKGAVIASRSKARREKAWSVLEEKVANGETVDGIIIEHVRGGYIVDVHGVSAFLPGSQAEIRPTEKRIEIPSEKKEFKIIKMDHARSNVIVSRRAVLEEQQREQRESFFRTLQVGATVKGTIKNITDYGAFVDIGGMDGLLHVTDISWNRVSNPREVLSVGDQLDVKIIDFNPETQRISLGLKQLSEDPWAGKLDKINVGDRMKGKVATLTDYGAFVELPDSIEGLVHVSEMSWTKKNVHPSKFLTVGDEVEVEVLEVDSEKRRLSLGIKQCKENPWIAYAASHKIGDIVDSEVKNITEFGLFIGLNEEIDGMIHIGDLDWDQAGDEVIKTYKIGDKVQAKILDIQAEKERVALSIKHVREDRADSKTPSSSASKNKVITGTVIEVADDAVYVDVDGTKGRIGKMDLAEQKSDCRLDRFAIGDKVDAKVISTTREGTLKLSIKALEIAEQKKIMKEYGSTESGAVLKNILGDALEEAKKEKK